MAQSAAAVIFSRGFDIVVAAVLMLLTLPLLLFICLILLFAGNGPVLYRQVRLGLHGKPFVLFKFRTLKPDAPEDRVIPEGDVAITPAGRLLRRYRLDELPQLLNVLSGEMAMVGPRPEIALDLTELDPDLRSRLLAIKPGITGPVQLTFIAEDELLAGVTDPTRVYRERLIPAKAAANLECFRMRSVPSDLNCLLQTVRVVFSSGAREASRSRLVEFAD